MSHLTARKVLVYMIGSLGDTIVAIPALRSVRRHFPNAELVLFQNDDNFGLVTAAEVISSKLINRSLSYSAHRSKFSNFSSLISELRNENFDAVVNLVISERSRRSLLRDRLFFRAAGIRNAFGFQPIPIKELFPVEPDGYPAATKHESIWKIDRLTADGMTQSHEDFRVPLIDVQPQDLAFAETWLRQNRSNPDSRLISIAPGCKSPASLWPLENFAAVGRRLTEEYGFEIVVTGGKSEFEAGEELIKEWRSGINSAGIFSVKQSAALLSQCSFHMGLDTGTTHLAAAVGTPCFVIFSERCNRGKWYPLGDRHTIIYHKVACAGCRLDQCSKADHPCMNGISVEAVNSNLDLFIDDVRNETLREIRVEAV